MRRVQEEEDDVKSRPQVSQTEAPKSHNRLTRSCDTSNDPAAIHTICKQFSEGTACYIRALLVFPLCCLAKIVWTFDTRRTDILYPSFLKRQRAINQSWGGGDVETGGGNGAFFLQEVKGAENCQSACSRRRSCTHCSCRLNRRKRRSVLRFHISTQNSSRSKNQQPSSSPRKQGEIALIC